ncbi:GNAT family N-acetyltransferase [Paenibacillus sp. GCM10012307]|uniref:GNAT family N-acetyltransferase n=1 Tax=Paenibacillus roseus TaxID=2798579 RepID=A0A934MJU9_9BACL|nr:GNAT family N-acetyltransferase [Paenibacillus roseus]MBJ6360310.1 GNAT family N-acetyltransferase [Paenibacillus roseus]
MGEVIFRLAEKQDAPRLVEVIYDAYVTIRDLNLHWPAAHANLGLVEENIADNECFVLEVDHRVAATVTLTRADNPMTALSGLPFLKWFAVDPAYQGKGYGANLLGWVEENIIRDRLGAPAVTLATAEKHPWLLPMYERRGYERIHAFDPGNGDGTMHLLRKIVDRGLYERFSRQRIGQAASG